MISTKDSSYKSLEDGELSNSSIDHETSNENSIDSTTNNIHSINCSLSNLSSNCSTNFSKYLNDQSLIDSERSLIEIFSMDVSQDCDYESNFKPKKKFTAWTDQLIEEQKMRSLISKFKLHYSNEKLINEKKATEENLKKRERIKLEKFSNDISRRLREKRGDIVQKVVEACGFVKSTELCTEAQKIYSTTGMLTPQGKKRTLGGCFFQLVKLKGGLTDEKKKEIFYEPTAMLPERIKRIKQAKKHLKKQLKKSQNPSKIEEELRKQFAAMNLNINISVRLK